MSITSANSKKDLRMAETPVYSTDSFRFATIQKALPRYIVEPRESRQKNYTTFHGLP